jgi:hypothetical protein
MATTVKTMFWDHVNNGLACVVIVGDVTLPVFDPKQSYTPDGGCLLNDPYEGGICLLCAVRSSDWRFVSARRRVDVSVC